MASAGKSGWLARYSLHTLILMGAEIVGLLALLYGLICVIIIYFAR